MARTPEITYKIMSAVKSKNTKPEMILRRELWSRGLRYRVNMKTITGKPDIIFTRAKIAVFCDGDFWHGHNWEIREMSSLEEELARYSEYWRQKILRNIERDKNVNEELASEGWIVLRFWESDIKADAEKCANIVEYTYRAMITKKREDKTRL